MKIVRDKLAPQIAYLEAIRKALPEDGILVDELTQMGYVARLAWPTYKPRTFLSPGYQGTLGWGYATSLGAKVAKPDTPVVSISGDGGFLFTAMEMATAAQHGIGVVAVVFSDGAYGNVKRIQQQAFNNRTIASDLRNPDFVKLGESFGLAAERVKSPEELSAAIARGIARGGPMLIDCPVGELARPVVAGAGSAEQEVLRERGPPQGVTPAESAHDLCWERATPVAQSFFASTKMRD